MCIIDFAVDRKITIAGKILAARSADKRLVTLLLVLPDRSCF